jgi:hypothetical protein
MMGDWTRQHTNADGTPKRVYGSREEALQAAVTRPVELDAYECRLCGRWHLGTT